MNATIVTFAYTNLVERRLLKVLIARREACMILGSRLITLESVPRGYSGQKLCAFARIIDKYRMTTRPICTKCNTNLCKTNGRNKLTGLPYYCNMCSACNRNTYSSKYAFRKHKKDTCERCGFVPEDPCQLDVDHIDENHNNGDPSNLQTLCANCHRLKTLRCLRERQTNALQGL